MSQAKQVKFDETTGQLVAINGAGTPYTLTPPSGGGQANTNYVITNYVATGAEGTDFMVDLSVAMLNDTYGLVWAPAGVAAIPVLDLPNIAAGDRTTTQFRVLLAAPLTNGDKLTFIAFAS